MILATIRELAKTLGCRLDQADDVVRSEPSARAALSRRGLFKAAGAVAAGVAFSDGARELVTLDAWEFRLSFWPLASWNAPGVVGSMRPMRVVAVDHLRGTFTVGT